MDTYLRVSLACAIPALALFLTGHTAFGESFCPDFDGTAHEVWAEFEDRLDKGERMSSDEIIRLFEPYEETRRPEVLAALGLSFMYSMADHGWDQRKFERSVRLLNNAAYCGHIYAMELLIGIHEKDHRGSKAKPNLANCLQDGIDYITYQRYYGDEHTRVRARNEDVARRVRACGIWPMTDPPTITDDSPPRP